MDDSALRALRDRIEIEELMHRYARMVDRREWSLMHSVFAPGASIDYVSTGGQAGPYEQVLGWLHRALEPWPLNLHFISNLELRLEGERGHSTCYFHAPMGRLEPDGSHTIITNAGYYEDELVRLEPGWRIARRHCEQTLRIGRLPEGYVIPG